MTLSDDMRAAFRAGDNDRTRQLADNALRTARAGKDIDGEVDALCWLSRVALREGEYSNAAVLADQAFGVARSREQPSLTRMPLHLQAAAARMQGDLPRARGLYEASIALNQDLSDERMVTIELRNLAYVELHEGRSDRARNLFLKARDNALRLNYDDLRSYLVVDAATLAVEDNDPVEAAQLIGAAEAAFRAKNEVAAPDDAAELVWLNSKLAAMLGAEQLQVERVEGSRRSVDSIVGALRTAKGAT